MSTDTHYSINTVASAMRLLVLASSVRGEVSEATMQELGSIAERKGLTIDALVRIIAEHERDAKERHDSSAQYFEGRRHLPQMLVDRAVDAITDQTIQLDLAVLMMRLVTAGDDAHHKAEVLFVEYCVARWGIRDVWHAYLSDDS